MTFLASLEKPLPLVGRAEGAAGVEGSGGDVEDGLGVETVQVEAMLV